MIDKGAKLLMIGSSATTYRMGEIVIKVPRIDAEPLIMADNARAMEAEANVYRMLGQHARIASCQYVSPTGDMVLLDFYPNGNLKHYVRKYGVQHFARWAAQMIEAVAFLHQKGVRHSDIRLDQWLVDDALNVRLCDFNSADSDGDDEMEIQPFTSLGIESASHFMPRNSQADSTVASDLFALGSALYELEYGDVPYAGLDDQTIIERFEMGQFPPVSDLKLGSIIADAWNQKYLTANEMLEAGRRSCGL